MKKQLVLALATLCTVACRPKTPTVDPGAPHPTAKHVKWIQIDMDAAGTLAKCAVYHDDANDIPAAVRELAERKFPGATGRYFETELYADVGLVFEVAVQTREGKHCEIAGKADGTELYTECELDTKQVPGAVLSAVRRLLPEGQIQEAEAKHGPSVDEIDLEVRVGTELHYLRYGSDGTLMQHLVRMRGSVEPATP